MSFLSESSLHRDPFEQFRLWFDEACECEAIIDANAMCLSTTLPDGSPDSRMVLLKEYDSEGFVFFTNTTSVKGRSLREHPKAAVNFFWDPLRRQVRIRGDVAQTTADEADRYFASRPRGSQIGAWASLQSEPLDARETLIQRVKSFEEEFAGRDVPRPPHWSGFRLSPVSIEFWQEGESRLHDRFEYRREEKGWQITRRYP